VGYTCPYSLRENTLKFTTEQLKEVLRKLKKTDAKLSKTIS
jgi:hypothetical protein